MEEALGYMRQWLEFSAEFAKVVAAWPEWGRESLLGDKQAAMKNMLMNVLKESPGDFRVSEALGVLGVTTNDFASAVEHFRAAVALR